MIQRYKLLEGVNDMQSTRMSWKAMMISWSSLSPRSSRRFITLIWMLEQISLQYFQWHINLSGKPWLFCLLRLCICQTSHTFDGYSIYTQASQTNKLVSKGLLMVLNKVGINSRWLKSRIRIHWSVNSHCIVWFFEKSVHRNPKDSYSAHHGATMMYLHTFGLAWL